MSGSFKHVWKRLWSELWLPLAESRKHPELFFADLYRGLRRAPSPPAEPEKPSDDAFDQDGDLVDPATIAAFDLYQRALEIYQKDRSDYELASTGQGSKEALRALIRTKDRTEIEALACLAKTYTTLVDLEEVEAADLYKTLLIEAIDTYNLGYLFVEPFVLAPTVPGIISRLFAEMKRLSELDAHVQKLHRDYEEACVDLSTDPTSGRIQSCINKQFMLLEGTAKRTFKTKATTLGAICDEVKTWPHTTLQEVGKKLYGFRSDYPGFGHGGNPDAVLRDVDLRDFLGVSCMLAGLFPYMHAEIDLVGVYRG